MKDYDSIILWIDYYNKTLSREKGRKISKSLAIYDPMLSELIIAAESLGYEIDKNQINEDARYPMRPHIKSGYIMLPKKQLRKGEILKSTAEKIISNRTKQKHK